MNKSKFIKKVACLTLVLSLFGMNSFAGSKTDAKKAAEQEEVLLPALVSIRGKIKVSTKKEVTMVTITTTSKQTFLLILDAGAGSLTMEDLKALKKEECVTLTGYKDTSCGVFKVRMLGKPQTDVLAPGDAK